MADFRSASSGTLSFSGTSVPIGSLPSGWQPGDLCLIAAVLFHTTAGPTGYTVPAGWTEVGDTQPGYFNDENGVFEDYNTKARTVFAYRYLQSGDAAPTFTVAPSRTGYAGCWVAVAYSDAGAAIGDDSAGYGAFDESLPDDRKGEQVTATQAGELHVAIGSFYGNTTSNVDYPSDANGRVEQQGAATTQTLAVADRVVTAAGAERLTWQPGEFEGFEAATFYDVILSGGGGNPIVMMP